MPAPLLARRLIAACALALLPLAAWAQAKSCTVLLMPAANDAQSLAPLAKRVQAVCTSRTLGAGQDVARAVRDARRDGAKRVLLAGHGAGVSAALAYAGQPGDVDGVIAFGGEPGPGDLPTLAPRMKQHIPLLWLVGSGDAMAKLGEDYAFAKAPPHPASRFQAVKGDAAEAGARAALEWIKSLE